MFRTVKRFFFFTKNKDYVFSKACVKKTEMIKTLHNKNKSLDSSRSRNKLSSSL